MTAPLPPVNAASPETLFFGTDGRVPNHPRYPVLLYRAVLVAGDDLAVAFERLFTRHGWPPRWRDGVYPYHHYHADTHEAFGIAAGRACLRLGGGQGRDIEIRAGDVLVLPAGTSHCGLSASDDFLAVGAYPSDAEVDMQRESDGVPAAVKARILSVAHPGADPAFGAEGPLMSLWPSSTSDGETRA